MKTRERDDLPETPTGRRSLCCIRRAEPQEAAALAAVAWAAKASWGYSAMELAAWRAELSPSPASIRMRPTYVAEIEGRIVGFHALDMDCSPVDLAHLWVQPEFMRRGIGRSLLAHAMQFLAAGGHACLHIDADPGAEPFYLAQGAVRVGVTRAPIDGDPDRVRPRLLLPTNRSRAA